MPRIRPRLNEREGELAEDIRKRHGGALTIKDVSDYFGISRDTARAFLAGIPPIHIGKRAMWLAADVARGAEGRSF